MGALIGLMASLTASISSIVRWGEPFDLDFDDDPLLGPGELYRL